MIEFIFKWVLGRYWCSFDSCIGSLCRWTMWSRPLFCISVLHPKLTTLLCTDAQAIHSNRLNLFIHPLCSRRQTCHTIVYFLPQVRNASWNINDMLPCLCKISFVNVAYNIASPFSVAPTLCHRDRSTMGMRTTTGLMSNSCTLNATWWLRLTGDTNT